MKTITLTGDNGEKYQVNIVYSIFDITNSSLQENFEVASADNAQQALKTYNQATGRTCNYKRTDAYSIFQDASVCVSSQFYDKDGIKYKYGRRTWFKII